MNTKDYNNINNLIDNLFKSIKSCPFNNINLINGKIDENEFIIKSICDFSDQLDICYNWIININSSFDDISKKFINFTNIDNINSINININDIYVKKIIKKFKLLSLNVKLTSLQSQLYIHETTKQILELITIGKINNEIDAKFNSIISIIEKISILIEKLLTTIDLLITIINSALIGLDEKTMAFFVTPKIILKGKMSEVCAENKSIDIAANVKSEVFNVIDNFKNKIKQSNKAIKDNYILNQINKFNNDGVIPDGDDLILNQISDDSIKSYITPLISSIYYSTEALPKYERLSLLNLGYLDWLNSYFIPAMHNSFGMPI
jgi:hypothetical protein